MNISPNIIILIIMITFKKGPLFSNVKKLFHWGFKYGKTNKNNEPTHRITNKQYIYTSTRIHYICNYKYRYHIVILLRRRNATGSNTSTNLYLCI